jgi:hypothetical protein
MYPSTYSVEGAARSSLGGDATDRGFRKFCVRKGMRRTQLLTCACSFRLAPALTCSLCDASFLFDSSIRSLHARRPFFSASHAAIEASIASIKVLLPIYLSSHKKPFTPPCVLHACKSSSLLLVLLASYIDSLPFRFLVENLRILFFLFLQAKNMIQANY